MPMNDGLSPKSPGPNAARTVRAMMRDRRASGRAAEFPCHSAADRQNSAVGGVGKIILKLLIYMAYLASRGHISAAYKRFLPDGSGNYGRISPGAARSEAPVRSALRNRAASHRRLYIDENSARSEGGEKLAPTSLGEDAVRHGEDQSVELGETVECYQLDTIFALGFGRVGERVRHQCRDAEIAQFRDDVGHAAVAQIGHVLLEGDPEDADFGALDRALGGDQELDETLRDKAPHAVIDAPAGEDHLRVVARRLGPRGQVIGIDPDAVPADEARRERQEIPFGARRLQHFL